MNHHFEPWYPIYRLYIQRWPMKDFFIRAEAEANNPGNFSSDMSRETYSDSRIFKTDHDFHLNTGLGEEPLRYPPVEVYCVTGEFPGADQSEFFFIALHSDGQHEDWVVHKPAGSWKGIKTLMERIGCDIPHY